MKRRDLFSALVLGGLTLVGGCRESHEPSADAGDAAVDAPEDVLADVSTEDAEEDAFVAIL